MAFVESAWQRHLRLAVLLTGNRSQAEELLQDSLASGNSPDLEVTQALAALPPGQRAVVVLRLYEDLSEQQAAAALGCSVGNIKSQYARALDKLRALVREPSLGRNR